MLRHRLYRFIGRCISRAMLGPVHLYGARLEGDAEGPDVILVPSHSGPTDCWLFWAKLKRTPVFIEKNQYADCWGYRWLTRSKRMPAPTTEELLEQMHGWLDNKRTLIVALDIGSQTAIDGVSHQLRHLVAQRKSLTVQVVTFNYDFRLLLGSPVHWIWRERALDLGKEPLWIVQELQALQKKAWSIKGYQTMSQFPLLQPSGRIPSALLLSWHEVRARRSWRWPTLSGWLWLPLALIAVVLNVVPLAISWLVNRQGLSWPNYQRPYWLGSVYLINHLCVWAAVLHQWGWFGVLYLPLIVLGLHPLGRLADSLVDSLETADSRNMRERIMNYFE